MDTSLLNIRKKMSNDKITGGNEKFLVKEFQFLKEPKQN